MISQGGLLSIDRFSYVFTNASSFFFVCEHVLSISLNLYMSDDDDDDDDDDDGDDNNNNA